MVRGVIFETVASVVLPDGHDVCCQLVKYFNKLELLVVATPSIAKVVYPDVLSWNFDGGERVQAGVEIFGTVNT
jgi:hypothetical protein